MFNVYINFFLILVNLKKDVRNKTVSLWSYINSYKNEFRNNAFIEHDGVVECSTSITSLQLWTAYYFQYKEIIDDSLNESTLNSMSYFGQNSKPNHAISYTITPPMPSVSFFFVFEIFDLVFGF